jgi:hypothetical protein
LYEKAKNSTEYNNWRKEAISLSTDIIKKLDPEDVDKFMHYEELLSQKEDELLQNAYKQGISDGAEITMKILKL